MFIYPGGSQLYASGSNLVVTAGNQTFSCQNAALESFSITPWRNDHEVFDVSGKVSIIPGPTEWTLEAEWLLYEPEVCPGNLIPKAAMDMTVIELLAEVNRKINERK